MAKEKGKFRKLIEDADRQRKENQTVFIVYMILRGLVIVAMIRQFMQESYEAFALCLLTLLLLYAPSFVKARYKVIVPQALEITILLFIYAAEILGEVNCYYTAIPYWDTILHTLNGFLCAAVGFSMVMLLSREEKILFRLSPAYISLVAFCFSMTIGVMWEFFEYFMDQVFLFDMQKDTVLHTISTVMLDHTSTQTPVVIRDITEVTVNGRELRLGGYLDLGLHDTMKDLFVNFLGAMSFSIIGYLALHGKKREQIITKSLMMRPVDPKGGEILDEMMGQEEPPKGKEPSGETVTETK